MNELIKILQKLREAFPVAGCEHFATLGAFAGEESTIDFFVWVTPQRLVSVHFMHKDRKLLSSDSWPNFVVSLVRSEANK